MQLNDMHLYQKLNDKKVYTYPFVTAWVDIGKTAKQRGKTWDSSFARCDRL